MMNNNPTTTASEKTISFISNLIKATEDEGFVKAWEVSQLTDSKFTIVFGCKHYSTQGFDFTCEITETNLKSDLFPSNLKPFGQLSSFDGDFSKVDLRGIAKHICDYYLHIWTPNDDDDDFI